MNRNHYHIRIIIISFFGFNRQQPSYPSWYFSKIFFCNHLNHFNHSMQNHCWRHLRGAPPELQATEPPSGRLHAPQLLPRQPRQIGRQLCDGSPRSGRKGRGRPLPLHLSLGNPNNAFLGQNHPFPGEGWVRPPRSGPPVFPVGGSPSLDCGAVVTDFWHDVKRRAENFSESVILGTFGANC